MDREYMRKCAALQLQRAIQVMRDACDKANRDSSAGDIEACRRVMHALAWGLANASSSIETAMSNAEDAHIIELHQAKEAAAAKEAQ